MKAREVQKRKKGYYKGVVYEALINYHRNHGVSDPKNRPLALCNSGLSELNPFGETLRIYFSFLKMFLFVSLICGGLTGFNTYLNLTGYFVNDRMMTSYVDYTTLANIYGFQNMTTDADAANWVED